MASGVTGKPRRIYPNIEIKDYLPNGAARNRKNIEPLAYEILDEHKSFLYIDLDSFGAGSAIDLDSQEDDRRYLDVASMGR